MIFYLVGSLKISPKLGEMGGAGIMIIPASAPLSAVGITFNLKF